MTPVGSRCGRCTSSWRRHHELVFQIEDYHGVALDGVGGNDSRCSAFARGRPGITAPKRADGGSFAARRPRPCQPPDPPTTSRSVEPRPGSSRPWVSRTDVDKMQHPPPRTRTADRRRRAFRAALLGALAVCALAAPTAQAAKPGFNIRPGAGHALQAQQLGMHWVRMFLPWNRHRARRRLRPQLDRRLRTGLPREPRDEIAPRRRRHPRWETGSTTNTCRRPIPRNTPRFVTMRHTLGSRVAHTKSGTRRTLHLVDGRPRPGGLREPPEARPIRRSRPRTRKRPWCSAG